MANYIITKNAEYFSKIGEYLYCNLEDMILPDVIAIDTETTGFIPRHNDVFCVQIGTGKNNYIIVMYEDNYSFEDIIPYIQNKTLIFHNALFDLGFCYKHNFYPEDVRDTMLASKILYNGDSTIRHDFGNVMARELNVKYDKTDQKNIHIVKLSQKSTIEYSFNDVDRLIELHNELSKKIDLEGFRDTYDLHCRFIRALAYMEQCGLPISSKLWKEKMNVDTKNTKKWKQKVEEYIYDNLPQFANRQLSLFSEIKEFYIPLDTTIQEDVQNAFNYVRDSGPFSPSYQSEYYHLNDDELKEKLLLDITEKRSQLEKNIFVALSSSKQMIKVFNALGIKTKDKDGKDSINESIISKSKHEFVNMWLKYQEANHRVTTFGDKIYQQIENERIYTNFNPMVDTSRLSTRKGNINFLNFPSDSITRECFEANDGNIMIVCDYSGQETVVAADLSSDAAMIASVVNGDDLHCAFARVLFPELKELSDEEIIKHHKDKRSAAKAPRFAFSYGGSAYTIHQNEGIPLDEAYKIESAFKELHEGLYTWGDKVFEESIKNGYIESADGWKLKLPNFSIFLEYKKEVENITKENWKVYKEGKLEVKKFYEEKEKGIKYSYIYPKSVEYYKSKKTIVSKFFKLKSEYQRLCLNNPVQARSAHQLKLSTVLLFEWILKNNLINVVKIVNTIHDEIVVECPIHLKELVKKIVEKSMLKGGNHYLTNLKIKADANYGKSWGKAK
jgi:DNA polymerase I-like protein with 3'-5' exonuclease and polymerase domains